jgi:hypothetical protein
MQQKIPDLHVVVQFGAGVAPSVQGPALLAFERSLRELSGGQWIEVFKEVKGDDSRLRTSMTREERSKL